MAKPEILSDNLKVGIAQISPVWLNRSETLTKIIKYVKQAANEGCQLITFSEAFLPGYPFWIEHTEGARFNSPVQKDIFAFYMSQAIQIEEGHLDQLISVISQKKIAVYVGCIERAADRGGHSLYCSLIYIDNKGKIRSVHRKLMPTYEERLTWAPGDGNGLRVHKLGAFTLGGLNCWENWMPLARTALYAQGEDLHLAAWPGNIRNTNDITLFIARESRSYVISASGLMRKKDIPAEIPHCELILKNSPDIMANGGSCIAAPDGTWVVEPVKEKEMLITANLDHQKIRAERQNFDPTGHYARPDITRLTVNRKRQSSVQIYE